MRSNLLSLQTISKQVSSTQNNLATGNKVNSAIDNPSSYYTAAALNNRAKDLDALLDSMGQAVSAIKAATTALEAGADFLEQAAAVATQALETASVPAKSFFEDKAGANGAVVTTAQELKDAVAAGKETIVVYGKIDYFENENITLKPGQRLVGTEYFTGYSGQAKFSELNFKSNVSGSAVNLADNTLVSDLKINYNNSLNENIYALKLDGIKTATINNIDVKLTATEANTGKAAILSYDGAILNIKGNNNIQTNGSYSYGIYTFSNSATNISGKVNIQTSGTNAHGIFTSSNSTANISGEVSIQTNDTSAHGILTLSKSTTNISGKINIQTSGTNAYGIYTLSNSTANISGTVRLQTQTHGIYTSDKSTANLSGNLWVDVVYGYAIVNSVSSGNTTNILSGTQIYLTTGNNFPLISNGSDDGHGKNILDIAADVKIATEKDGAAEWYKTNSDYHEENTSTTAIKYISTDDLATKLDSTKTAAWSLPEIETTTETSREISGKDQYQQILNQYDNLINDASYKGTNLLDSGSLCVKFNETGNSRLQVNGKDMSSTALGLATTDWQTQGDIAQSLSEISAALKNIRSFSAELGNNYSIITNRQSFTENLMNLLTEGADKLTLADINEESAQILALQTRQQLAINSLSLASNASRAVLKLF